MEIRDYKKEREIKSKTFELITDSYPLGFGVYEYADNKLIIAISGDFSYYHNCEILIRGVEYINCTEIWNADFDEDYLRIIRYNNNDFIRLEMQSDTGYTFYVVGKSLEFNLHMVYYYDREELKPGERTNRQPSKIWE